MPHDALAAAYILGLLFSEALRLPYRRRRARSVRSKTRHAPRSVSEVLVLAAVLVGIWILPLIDVFTPWLSRFDVVLPGWTAWPALAVFLLSLLLRWRAHADLGESWSHTVELYDKQRLVTTGVYRRIRHPMYASLILWAIAQPLLLQNAVAGWGGAIAVALIWLVRVPAEERMMREGFGDEYDRYASQTGRLIPKRTPPRPPDAAGSA